MPSASTTRPLAGSDAIESSLCERTIPGSVALVISSIWERSIQGLELDFGTARRGFVGGLGCTGSRCAHCGRELFAALERLSGSFSIARSRNATIPAGTFGLMLRMLVGGSLEILNIRPPIDAMALIATTRP